jgi:hypothetical protein
MNMASILARAALVLAIISLAFIIAIIIISKLNHDQCKQMIIPTYADTIHLMKNFAYKNQAARFTAQSIAYYQIYNESKDHVARKWDLNKLTDFALHSITTGQLLKTPSRIDIVNHPQFISFVTDYDTSTRRFSTEEIRMQAAQLVKINKEDVRSHTVNDMQIYNLLIGV